MEHHIRLAQALPPQLLQLFRRFPPRQLSGLRASASNPPIQAPGFVETTETSPPSDPIAIATTLLPKESHKKTNPFLPWKNPGTGKWHGPHYSLRRQAELFKLAKTHNVLSLMPVSPKHPEIKEKKRVERGVRVQGTGEGKRVKGKYWERTLKVRLDARRKAMEGMPALIKKWRESGRGRGWKKWPK